MSKRPVEELYDQQGVEHTLDCVLVEHALKETSELEEVSTIQAIEALPRDSLVLECYWEVQLKEADPLDEEMAVFNRFHEHLFCEFFRMQAKRHWRGTRTTEAIDHTERRLVNGLLDLFEREEDQVPEAALVRDIADAFRDEHDRLWDQYQPESG